MTRSIDERIVQMQFNNQQFERGVSTSMRTLQGLKESLKLDAATKNINNLSRADKEFSLQNMSASIDAISSKFSALGIVGITAIQNLTNSAINMGKRVVSALTIDPIKMGFDEYETKMNAIQTIMTNTASKGTTMTDVTSALNELNTYADKTIYNFAEMARNIGTFTAAGVGLKESTAAIKGIANLAAGSGSNAQQASTAMYQLSQAMASGTVKLMDWNSVVNAGMGGELFQKALEKTAVELGHGRDMSVSFRESLEKGWITTEVLTKTLNKFANDESLIKAATQVKTFTQLFDTMKESVQSGWAQTWETIIGNKDEAAGFLTAINDVFGGIAGASAKARNDMLKQWNTGGGRYMVIEALFNAFKGLQEIIAPILQAFRDIFPAMTVERLLKMSEALRNISRHFTVSAETSDNLRRTFRGVFAVLDIGRQVISAVANGIFSLIGATAPAGGALLSFTAHIGDLLYGLDLLIKKSGILTATMSVVVKVLTVAFSIIQTIAGAISKTLGGIGTNIDVSGLKGFTTNAMDVLAPLKLFVDKLQNGFVKVAAVANKVGKVFKELTSALFDGIKKAFANSDVDMSKVLDVFNVGVLVTLIIGMKKFMGILNNIMSGGSKFMSSVTGVLDAVRGSLEAYQNNLKASMIFKIAAAIGILAAALYVMAGIDQEQLKVALAGITVLFADLFGSVIGFSKIMTATGFAAVTQSSLAMIAMSVAVLLLSSAMAKMAKLDWDSIYRGSMALVILTGIIIAISKLMDKNSKGLIQAAFSFALFSFSLGSLTKALKSLSAVVENLGSMETGKLKKGLIAIGVLLTQILLFSRLSGMDKMNASQGLGMIGFSVGLSILVSAVSKFADMDPGKIGKSLISISALLAIVGLFLKMTAGSRSTVGNAVALVILASSLFIFADAIDKMSEMPLLDIGKGLLAIGATLVIVAKAMSMLPIDMLPKAAGVAIIAASLLVLSGSLKVMATMSMFEIAKSLIALAGSMFILTTAMSAMTTGVVGAGALIAITAALTLFIPTLIMLGNIPLAVIGVGLLGIAGVFGVLAIAGLLLAPMTPVILALALAVAALGIGCAAAGAGIALFGMGLATLAVSGAAGVAALTAVFTGVISLIPLLVKVLALAILDFIKIIGQGTPIIVKTLNRLIAGICEVLVKSLPVIMATLEKIIPKILGFLVRITPVLVSGLTKLLVAILSNLTKYAGIIIDAAVKFIVGLANALIGKAFVLVDAAFKLIISFINGLAEAIRKNHNALYDAIGNLITALVEAITDLLPKVVEVGGKVVTSLAKGIGSSAGEFVDAGKNAVSGFIEGIKKKMGFGKKAGTELGKEVSDATKKELDINSPSGEYMDIGEYSADGLAIGIKNNTYKAVNASKDMVAQVLGATSKGFNLNPASKGGYQMYGSEVVDGLIAGMKKNTPKVSVQAKETTKQATEATKDSIKSTKAWIAQQKSMHALSLTEEMNAWIKIQNDYKKGTDERKQIDSQIAYLRDQIRKKEKTADDKAYSEKKSKLSKEQEAAQKAYEADTQRIEDKKYYNQLSLTQELKMWQNMQSKYKKNSDERKKIDKEIYRVKQELIQESADKEKDAYDKHMAWIDEKKYYGKLPLKQELLQLEMIKKKYKLTAEQMKAVNRDIYRVNQEITNDKTNKQIAAYDKELTRITDLKDYNQMSLGEELAAYQHIQKTYVLNADERKDIDKKIYDTKRAILEKQKELDDEYYNQTKATNDKLKEDILSLNNEYANAVKSRADALYATHGLFDKVEKQEAVEGTILIENLRDQVKEFDLWQENINTLGHKGLGKGLIDELRSMGPKALAQIQALNSLSAPELDQYSSLWKVKTAEATAQAVAELEPLKTSTSVKIEELTKQAKTDLEVYKQAWLTKTKEITVGVDTELATVAAAVPEKVSQMTVQMEVSLTALTSNIKTIFASQKWSDIGINIVDGITNGIKSRSTTLANEAARTAKLALTTAKKTLGIKSPSKEFEKVGAFAIEGFVLGFSGNAKSVETVGTETGNTAIDSLKKAMSKVSDAILSDVDLNPTIRPVIDMTDVQNGIATVFGQTQGIDVSVASAKASTIAMASNKGTDGSTINQSDTNVSAPIQIIQQNTVRNDNDIKKINQGLKNIVDRYAYAKGVLVP